MKKGDKKKLGTLFVPFYHYLLILLYSNDEWRLEAKMRSFAVYFQHKFTIPFANRFAFALDFEMLKNNFFFFHAFLECKTYIYVTLRTSEVLAAEAN